jgi:hypothetical protein
MKPNPVLAPVLRAQDQVEFLTEQRVIRMSYPETLALNVANRRN